MSDNQAVRNTDREIWRGPDEGNGSYYADSIHVTEQGGIGINVGGTVFVKPVREWHRLAAQDWPPRVEGSRTGAPSADHSGNLAGVDTFLGEIIDLTRSLRQGGPDAMDLEDLSDSLAAAVDMAAQARDLLNAAPPARSAASIDDIPLGHQEGDIITYVMENGNGRILHVERPSAAPTTSPEPKKHFCLDCSETVTTTPCCDRCGGMVIGPVKDASPVPPSALAQEALSQIGSLYAVSSPEPDAVRDLPGALAVELAPKFDAFLNNPGNPHLAADLRQWFWDNKSGVLAALSRPAHGGWQDISTAPTDGTPIEGCYHDDPEADALPVTSAFWSRISECWYSDIAGKPVKLTHWRPLSRRPALSRNDRVTFQPDTDGDRS